MNQIFTYAAVVASVVGVRAERLEIGVTSGDWQPLAEHDILIDGEHNSTSLQIERVVVPTWIESS